VPAYQGPFANGTPIAYASVEAPADTVWVGEGEQKQTIYDMAWANVAETPVIIPGSPRVLKNTVSGANQELVERHTEFTNVIWCDGHAKSVKLDYLAATHTMPNGDKVLFRFSIADD